MLLDMDNVGNNSRFVRLWYTVLPAEETISSPASHTSTTHQQFFDDLFPKSAVFLGTFSNDALRFDSNTVSMFEFETAKSSSSLFVEPLKEDHEIFDSTSSSLQTLSDPKVLLGIEPTTLSQQKTSGSHEVSAHDQLSMHPEASLRSADNDSLKSTFNQDVRSPSDMVADDYAEVNDISAIISDGTETRSRAGGRPRNHHFKLLHDIAQVCSLTVMLVL